MDCIKDISTLEKEVKAGESIELIVEYRGNKRHLFGTYHPPNRILHPDKDQTFYEFDFDSKKVSIIDEKGNSNYHGLKVCGYKRV